MEIPELLHNYMKDMAINHPALLHQDEVGHEAFAVDQLSDMLDGNFRVGLKTQGAMMRFIEPQFRPFNDEGEGMNTWIETGFAIIQRAEDLTAQAIKAAKNPCFKIIKQVIARMVYDSRNGNELLQYALNQLQQGEFVKSDVIFQNDGTWAGYLVTYKFQTEYIEDIEQEVTETGWLDI
jgi:hypothetical protein